MEASYVQEYLKRMHEKIAGESVRSLIFRGQSDESKGIQSGAKRRLDKSNSKHKDLIAEKDFVKYHLDLLKNSSSVDEYNSLGLEGMELFAQIQHYGGATLLTDFTKDFLVALFFATKSYGSICIEDDEIDCANRQCIECKEKCPKNRDQDCDGRVFIINIKSKFNTTAIRRLRTDMLGKEPYCNIKNLLFFTHRTHDKHIKPYVWIWEPVPKGNTRIRSQSSVFLFGLPSFKNEYLEYNSIIIEKKHKPLIRKELEEIFNVSAETLFPDLPGYSQISNSVDMPYEIKPCVESGEDCLNDANVDAAIAHFNHALTCIGGENNICKLKCSHKDKPEILHYYLGVSRYKEGIEKDDAEILEFAIIEFKKALYVLNQKDSFDKDGESYKEKTLDGIVNCLYFIKSYDDALNFHLQRDSSYSSKIVHHLIALELSLFSGNKEQYRKQLKLVKLRNEKEAFRSEKHIGFLKCFFEIMHTVHFESEEK